MLSDPRSRCTNAGDVGIGERLVVATDELGGLGQQVIEVALPPRGVGLVLWDVAERPRGVDHRFDAASKA